MTEDNDKVKDETGNVNGKDEKRAMLGLAPVETTHELKLKDRTLEYKARAGVIPLKDENGETEAEIFTMAYDLASEGDRSQRPLTFVFDGGPGSSSVWLHMGRIVGDRDRYVRLARFQGGPYHIRETVLRLAAPVQGLTASSSQSVMR